MRFAVSACGIGAVAAGACVRLTLFGRGVQRVLWCCAVGARNIARRRAGGASCGSTDSVAIGYTVAAVFGSTDARADVQLALVRLVAAGTVDQVVSGCAEL